MSDRPSGATGWIRGLFGGKKAEPAHQSGKELLATGRRALLAAESLSADAICCSVHDALPADWSAINLFGRPVNLTLTEHARGAVAAASGLALAGRRTAALIRAGSSSGINEELIKAVERRVPLVVYLISGDKSHAAYHALAQSGAFLLFARSTQEAIDLSMAARHAAERALIPAVISIDGPETACAIQDLRIPDQALVHEYLGDSDGDIASPTHEQKILFGGNRRRVPRWFDLDRPVALGQPLTGGDLDAAVAGRRAFAAAMVDGLLRNSLRRLSDLTGREMPLVSRHLTDDAGHLLIAQGAAVETAIAVADHLRETERVKIGVLGLSWLRPLPADEIRDALAHAASATVLDRTAGPGEPELLQEVRSLLRAGRPELLSATYTGIDASDLLAVCKNMRSGDRARRSVHLGVVSSAESTYPRRQAMLQRVRRYFPAIDNSLLPAGDADGLKPPLSQAVDVYARGAQPPEDLLEALADLMAESAGKKQRGICEPAAPGIWKARIVASPEAPPVPGVESVADLTIIRGVEQPMETDPLTGLADRAQVAFVSELDGEQLWNRMPSSWRRRVGEKELRLFLLPLERGALVAVVEKLLAGDHEELQEIAWRELPQGGPDVEDDSLPVIVRRFETTGSTYDNVARFWGELVQPRSGGESGDPVPDPYLALGAVPACTATFHDMTGRREKAPVINPLPCTGCGQCWAACPDSAIGSVAIGTEALLDTAAGWAEAKSEDLPSAASTKLRSVHRQLAARIDGRLAKADQPAVTSDLLRESFDWLMEQMKISEPELPAFTRAFEAMLAEIERLPLAVTDAFFLERHRQEKGSGELTMLAVNPQACQGCGICEAVCPDDAIAMTGQDAEMVAAMRAGWNGWEQLPDTSGKSIAKAAEHPVVGPLPAVLMSRHCLFSVAGGEGAEPGSGERLATRQVAAVIEYQMQRRLVGQADLLEDLAKRLREAISSRLAEVMPVDELDSLEEVLGETPGRTARLGELLSRLDEQGASSDVAVPAVRRLVHAAREIGQARWRISEGFLGMGRARYGLVVAGRSAAGWAARFPRNPFGAPVAVDLTGSGAELALGIIEGLAAERVTEARVIRQAELAIEAPADLPARERELRGLGWRQLSPGEMVLCPPILVLAGMDALPGIPRLLDSGLPVKIILLDDCDLRMPGGDPLLQALAHRNAFVLSASVAHTEHLFHGVTAALNVAGPAFIHLHAPSPGRHGFAAHETVDRARLAVDSRVHPLLHYDPSGEGVFGSRISLEGNPQVEELLASGVDGVALTPVHWAVGEGRYKDCFSFSTGEGAQSIDEYLRSSSGARGSANPTVPGPNGTSLAVGEDIAGAASERLERWATLQELAGAVTPFTASVRAEIEEELRDEHAAELADLKAEADARVAALEREQAAAQAVRLRDRLLQLAGFAAPRAEKPGEEGER